MRRTVIAGAASVALIAWGLFLWSHRASSRDASRPQESTERTTAAGGGEGTPPPAHRFTFERAVHVTMDSRELVELRLRGSLWVARRHEGEALVAFIKFENLESPNERESERRRAPALPSARVELTERSSAAPVVFVAPDAVGDEEWRQASARLARDLIDQYRFFATADLQGSYEARITKAANGRSLRKIKLRYLTPPLSNARLPESRHELSLAADGWPALLTGTETILLGEQRMAMRSESSYRISATAEMPSSNELATLARGAWQRVELATASTAPRRRGTHAPPTPLELKDVPGWEELLARLRSGGLTQGSERLAWFRSAVKRLDASGASTGAGALQSALSDSRGSQSELQLLTGALAASLSPEAGQALLDAYRDERFPAEARALVMTAWIGADVALPAATTAYLSALATDPSTPPSEAQSALLALGSQLARAPGEGSASAIESLLIARLGQATSDADVAAALDAMGNAGSADFLPYIQPELSSPSPLVRAHAYLALRLIPGAAVTALLQGGQSDPSAQVQTSLKLALEMRSSASL